jgi:CheY-like chemotaxis protein
MDIRLPGINGIETMRRIRELPALQHVPILAVTASTMPEEKDELLAAGFSAFLGKPYRFRELMSVVRKALDTTC